MRSSAVLLYWMILICFGNPEIFGQNISENQKKALPFAVSLDTMLMGSSFLLTAVHNTSDSAWIALYKGLDEIVRIEKLISSWQASSETSNINNNAGIKPVKVSTELFDLIQRSKKISKLSNGYFDISFASAERYWTFDGSTISKPSDEEVKATVSKVDFENIICDPQNQTVFLKEKGMRIGFGAIGKGYAANRASEKMKSAGALSGVVNAGGDLMCWGTKPDGSAWQVGIINPNKTDQVELSLSAVNNAVVTSGNYLKFVLIEGTRYGHIIDPKTGWPAKGLVSVTIICPDAELADALATTVFVLGEKEGLKLINHLEGIETIMVNDQGDYIASTGIDKRLVEQMRNQ